uniref:Uncharacterized protein n=1 Tax=Nelumbo nucifera TaxID=4432 RepID=A0A822YXM4_NELNU|nr:TPA_asm: hypothetical protein HUJ06_006709 [Nelumbo nucifera]
MAMQFMTNRIKYRLSRTRNIKAWPSKHMPSEFQLSSTAHVLLLRFYPVHAWSSYMEIHKNQRTYTIRSPYRKAIYTTLTKLH